MLLLSPNPFDADGKKLADDLQEEYFKDVVGNQDKRESLEKHVGFTNLMKSGFACGHFARKSMKNLRRIATTSGK